MLLKDCGGGDPRDGERDEARLQNVRQDEDPAAGPLPARYAQPCTFSRPLAGLQVYIVFDYTFLTDFFLYLESDFSLILCYLRIYMD